MADDDWDILYRKVLGAIRLSLTSIVAFNVYREKMIKDLMAALSKMYEKSSASNKIFLDEVVVQSYDGGQRKRR